MEVERTTIDGVLILRPKVFRDPRGYFLESFNQEQFNQATGNTTVFVQDNESGSSKGLLRGLHMQVGEHAQAKLVRVAAGAVLDVCDPEPLPTDHPLWRHPRVVLTPHVASMTQPETAVPVLIQNLRRHQRGEVLLDEIDRSTGY